MSRSSLRLIVFLSVLIVMIITPLMTTSEVKAQVFNVTTRSAAKLRGGPGTNFPSLSLIPAKTAMPAFGRSENNKWIQVQYQNLMGWVAIQLLTLEGDINALPVSNYLAPTPEPSPTPKMVSVPRAEMNKFCVTRLPIPTAPDYVDGPGVHPIMLLKMEGGIHPYVNRMAQKLISYKPQLVACISSARWEVMEACDYVGVEDPNRLTKLTRYVQLIDIQIIVLQTGQVLGQNTIRGGDPDICHETEIFRSRSPEIRREGSQIIPAQVIEWINAFANRQ